MRLVNLTPHELKIHLQDGSIVVLPKPTGEIARLSVVVRHTDPLVLPQGACSVSEVEYGPITGLPDPREGTFYVTSLLVAQRAQRPDVLSPGELIRDNEGRPVGCRGLTAQPAGGPWLVLSIFDDLDLPDETRPGIQPYVVAFGNTPAEAAAAAVRTLNAELGSDEEMLPLEWAPTGDLGTPSARVRTRVKVTGETMSTERLWLTQVR